MRRKKSAFIFPLIGIVGAITLFGLVQAQSMSNIFTNDFWATSERKSPILGEEDETQIQETEREQEEIKNTIEQQGEEEKQAEEEQKETEIETVDGQKIKTKIEDYGVTKVEIEQDDLKIKYEVRNGVMTAQTEENEEDEFEEETEGEQEDATESGISIETDSDRRTIRSNQIQATTRFPLSIDVETNQLMITTPKGTKIVAVLPDQAVQNLLATGIVSSVNQTGTDDGGVEIIIQEDEPVYEIKGEKEYHLLAFIPINQPVTAIVSAETGEVITAQQSFVAKLVDLLSP